MEPGERLKEEYGGHGRGVKYGEGTGWLEVALGSASIPRGQLSGGAGTGENREI